MNIASTNLNFISNQASSPVVNKQLTQNQASIIKIGKNDYVTNNLRNVNNQSTVNSKASSRDTSNQSTYQTDSRINSVKDINPNLLDKVFKLKSKEEQNVINTNRPSDLYLQTEGINSSKLDDLGIGLDLYI